MNNKSISELFFNINRIRNDYYKIVNEIKNENKLSRTSSEVEDKKNEEDEQSSFNKIEDRISIEYIKSNCDDYNHDLDIKENSEKSMLKNHSKPIYNIPHKKIFKEDIKEIDIDENKYNGILDYLKIIEEEQKYEQLLQNGINSLSNNENVNNYLFDMLINNSINIYNNINNYNQFIFLNNNINFYENKTDCSYLPNNNIINSSQNQNTINKISIANNPEEYTIELKSKTNDPSIKKIIKIEVTSFFIKNCSKVRQEINGNSKNENTKNIINLNDIINGKEKRTVVRLEPIRQNCSSYDVSILLDNYLEKESGKNQRIYNALYVPLCKVLGKNMGYCFVMMVKPKYVIDFYNVFNGKIFGKKICKKPCKVTWADIQGEELLDPTEDDPFRKPIIFKDIINEEGDE